MKVGISIFAAENSNIWASGIAQNILFLVMALKAIPEIQEVFLINGGSGNILPAGWPSQWSQPLVRPEDVTYELDMVIVMGARLPEAWLLRIQALGVKIIFFDVGHAYAGLLETAIFRLPERGIYTAPMNETWIIHCHKKTCKPLLETITRKPVHIVPHIWSPEILETSVANLDKDKAGLFGFAQRRESGHRAWRVATFEPNISIIKNAFIPMLIADAAYRENPETIELIAAFNTFHLKEHITFNRFASHMNLTKNGKATYEPRMAFAEAVTQFQIDAVISHQIENDQNYLYYDAIYGNYPLIHNSIFLKNNDIGFYYPDFQAKAGARALINAITLTVNPDFWQDYKLRNEKFLKQVHPASAQNVEAFSKLLGLRNAEREHHAS